MAILLLAAIAATGAASQGSAPKGSGGAIVAGIIATHMADCETYRMPETTDVCDVQCVNAALFHIESALFPWIESSVANIEMSAIKAATGPPELHPPRAS